MKRQGFLVLLLLLANILTGCNNDSGAFSLPSSSLPSPPENLQLDPIGPSHVKLTWSSPYSDLQNLTLERFVIQRRENGGEFGQIAEVAPTSTDYVDNAVLPDTDYTYRVLTVNSSGQSDPVSSDVYRHPYFDACNSPLPAQTAPVETFYDFPVEGLNYSSQIPFSVTDTSGAFAWDRTTSADFSLGYVDLGSLNSGNRPGLLPLVYNLGGDRDTTLNNLLRLLIALDEDGDPTNRIQLPCELSLAYGQIDPTTDYATFAQQETVQRLTGGVPLPSADSARTVYRQQLYRDYVGHYDLTWSVVYSGILPISASIPFDIDINGTIHNMPSSVIRATVDAHNYYHLVIVDLAPLALINLGFYEIETSAYIRPDKTIDGTVTLKNFAFGDMEGRVSGGFVP